MRASEFKTVREINSLITTVLNQIFFSRDIGPRQCKLHIKRRCSHLSPSFKELMTEHIKFVRSKSFRRTAKSLIKRYDDCLSSFEELIIENRYSRYNCYLMIHTWFEVLKMVSSQQDPVYQNLQYNLIKDVLEKYEHHLGIPLQEVSLLMQSFFADVKSRKRKSFKVNIWINDAGPVNFNHLLLENQKLVLAAAKKERYLASSERSGIGAQSLFL